MALNFDSITAIARKKYIPQLVDNIYESSAYLSMLREDGMVIDGGTEIVQPVLYAKNTARGGYKGMDPHNVNAPATRTAAKYDYGNYYVSLVVSGEDGRKVNGDSQVINLLNTIFEEAELSMKDQIASDIFTGSTHIVGLDTAIAQGTYGGIDGSTYTWWQSGIDATAHTTANMKTSTHASYILTLFANAYNSAKHMGESPNLIVTSQEVWDIYENVIQSQIRYQYTNSRSEFLADGGFQVLEWRGIPVVVDDFVAGGTDSACYFINTKFSPLFFHPQNNFRQTPWKVPTNADGRIAQLYFTGQLGLSNRRMFYRFSDLAN